MYIIKHSFSALSILICSWKIGHKITHKLWACAQRDWSLFFRHVCNQYSGKPGEHSSISGDHFAFERHRVTFDLSKQSSVAAVKKHLTEFLGRGGACNEIWHDRFGAKAVQIVTYFQRNSEKKKTCKEIKDRLARTPIVFFWLRPIVKAFKLVLLLQACLRD